LISTREARPEAVEGQAVSRARFELLIVAGLVVFLLVLPHQIFGDARIRFDALARLLNRRRLTPISYSYVGPLFSAPLYYLGKHVLDPEWWCARYNTLLLAAGFASVHALFKEEQERVVLRTFFLILLAASMFPNHLMNFNAEPFTAVMVMVGVVAISTGRAPLGWTLLVLGVANTPATLVGLLFVALKYSFEKRRVTPLIPVAAAAALILLESWIRRGNPFLSGYEGDAGFRTVMPYSGLPGFSYPLLFGLLSIFLSFGKGLVFYAPGLLARFGRDDSRRLPRLSECYRCWLLFLAGMAIVYAKWWAWYGGLSWGPRFFLVASLPASLAIAVALRRAAPLSRIAAFGTLTALALSVWVCIDGAVFGQTNMGICAEKDYAQEFLCWYTPEFSALWRPFVAPSPVSRSGMWIISFCLISFVALIPAAVRGMVHAQSPTADLVVPSPDGH
jgi:hypothetical protein